MRDARPASEALPPRKAGLQSSEAGRAGFLAMDDDRALYVGLLGKPSWRALGAHTVYVSLGAPFALRYGDEAWQEHDMTVVRPYASHQVASRDKSIAVALIEPESLDLGRKPLDPRIAHIVKRIREQPEARHAAAECAREVHLSLSRFLHLFKSETGTPFRRFQAWKRARGVLPHVAKGATSLTVVALDGGYPDSTHFSHSIKHVYGLRPSEILSGSRRLELISR